MDTRIVRLWVGGMKDIECYWKGGAFSVRYKPAQGRLFLLLSASLSLGLRSCGLSPTPFGLSTVVALAKIVFRQPCW